MQLSTIRILDFAPSTGSLSGGEKILICLGQDIHPNILQLYQIQVFYKYLNYLKLLIINIRLCLNQLNQIHKI